jgi:hypothetical protein
MILTPQAFFQMTVPTRQYAQAIRRWYWTPGIVLGRFKVHNRFAFAIGGGYQIAVTQYHPPANHIAIASVHFPFEGAGSGRPRTQGFSEGAGGVKPYFVNVLLPSSLFTNSRNAAAALLFFELLTITAFCTIGG